MKFSSMKIRSLVITMLALVTCACTPLNPPLFDEAKWREAVEASSRGLLFAPHAREGRFFNPWLAEEQGGFARLLRWRLSRRGRYTVEEEGFRPRFVPDLTVRIGSIPAAQDFVAWIGHGSFLLRLQGEYWLIDPILSERALWPKRDTPSALSREELTRIAERFRVIVTNNHYDHLDRATIEMLPRGSQAYVPLGLRDYMLELGMTEVTQMDWWETVDCGGGVRLICLPAQHWSMRIGQWRNTTLWASFLIVTPTLTIYVGGDSGYFLGYREIGCRHPGIDLALLPVTAYHPRWFMHPAHLNAAEALDAFEELGARKMVPTQWGGFRLGDEPIGYPALDLQRVMRERNMEAARVVFMDVGGILPMGPGELP